MLKMGCRGFRYHVSAGEAPDPAPWRHLFIIEKLDRDFNDNSSMCNQVIALVKNGKSVYNLT